MNERVALIEERLRTGLTPDSLEIIDDSAAHAGHAGAREGGHFTVRIVSSVFAGKPLVQRHRLIYETMADLMRREIHALSIKAQTPDEARSANPDN